ncbi:unnamed protein product [Pleuronectes platessa]|uniref:GP-PDE domain-containing protein n=1 Tax=Pleuronectes platessa TaxID=8262 RepID=A0A9N7TTX7_PLEPL|nr:unnamed protein product [Pleuronectes platessa]
MYGAQGADVGGSKVPCSGALDRLAPENTLMSFEKAVEAGSEGLVTDVINSYDGVPFLMHDRTLRRTTNIDKVFLKTGPTPCGHVYLGGAAEPEHRAPGFFL